MDPGGIALFALADRRLAWLDQRQAVLAQNIANSDTPGYRARDIAPFAAATATAGAAFSTALARTDPAHFAAPADSQAGAAATPAAAAGAAGERAPDGNAVSLDEQLMRIADTDTAHELVTDLYSKYMGLFRTAIGR